MQTVAITFMEDFEQVTYSNVVSIEIVGGKRAKETIERWVDFSSMDKFHQYLVLHLDDMNTATFRFSEVLFRIE